MALLYLLKKHHMGGTIYSIQKSYIMQRTQETNEFNLPIHSAYLHTEAIKTDRI